MTLVTAIRRAYSDVRPNSTRRNAAVPTPIDLCSTRSRLPSCALTRHAAFSGRGRTEQGHTYGFRHGRGHQDGVRDTGDEQSQYNRAARFACARHSACWGARLRRSSSTMAHRLRRMPAIEGGAGLYSIPSLNGLCRLVTADRCGDGIEIDTLVTPPPVMRCAIDDHPILTAFAPKTAEDRARPNAWWRDSLSESRGAEQECASANRGHVLWTVAPAAARTRGFPVLPSRPRRPSSWHEQQLYLRKGCRSSNPE